MAKITLPDYTRGEELFNSISHIIGAGVGVCVLVLSVVFSAMAQNTAAIASSIVYGVTMILLYTMSSIYHGLKNEGAKKVFRVLDHCTIYFLIAGTYTPIALVGLMQVDYITGWVIFGFEWIFAAISITLTAIDLKKFRVFSMICYIAMGWCVVAVWSKTVQAMTLPGFTLLLAGGILYTIGAILYGIGKKKRYIHGVFHLFVLGGSILQFSAIFFYIILPL